jgi:pterin-4a-carbinolamine dehydratase
MTEEIDQDGIRQRWEQVGSKLDERGRRLWAAGEVPAAGHGALDVVSRITGLARSTIDRGEDDLEEGPLPDGRVRRKGGRGKPLTETDPTVVGNLESLVEPATLGSPVQPLRWVSKSREKLARALSEMGHKISANTVGKLLTEVLAFSRQVNRKADEGAHHPDRNAQFEYINAKVVAAQTEGEPVISVDTKKKELVGNYEKRRLRLPAEGTARPCQRARFRRRGTGQGGALRRLRRGGQRGLRQCRHHSGQGRVCRRGDPPLDRSHGPSALSAHARADHRRRLRRLDAHGLLWPLVGGETRTRDTSAAEGSENESRSFPRATH